ncbi:tetratricopeptide repeat protein [bacterium]|nr:tetratricopeptide repeat protein [bacterium]
MIRVLILLLALSLPLLAQPPSARNKFKIGRGFFSKGDYNQAIQFLNQALSEDPDYLDALYMLGLSYFGQKNYAKAEEQLQVVIRRDPQFLEAYQYLGQVYMAQKKYDQAKAHFQKMTGVPGAGVAAQYCLGVVYYQQKNLAMAEKSWREAVRLDNKDARSHNNLGVLSSVQGKHVEALAEFQLASKLNPENPSYLVNAAAEMITLKHLDQARAQLARVDKLSGQRLDVGAVGGAYLAKLDGNWDKVIQYTTLALNQNEDYTQAMMLKAEALEHMKKNEEALKFYEQAAESDPNLKEAEEAVARLKALQPKPEPKPEPQKKP